MMTIGIRETAGTTRTRNGASTRTVGAAEKAQKRFAGPGHSLARGYTAAHPTRVGRRLAAITGIPRFRLV